MGEDFLQGISTQRSADKVTCRCFVSFKTKAACLLGYTCRSLCRWTHTAHVGWGSEQPDLVEDVPAPSGGVGLDDL